MIIIRCGKCCNGGVEGEDRTLNSVCKESTKVKVTLQLSFARLRQLALSTWTDSGGESGHGGMW